MLRRGKGEGHSLARGGGSVLRPDGQRSGGALRGPVQPFTKTGTSAVASTLADGSFRR